MTEMNEGEISKVLLEFLDTDSFDEKYKILVATPLSDMTDLIIDNMAASIDVVIEEGDMEHRISELKNCVRTRARYEISRLRK